LSTHHHHPLFPLKRICHFSTHGISYHPLSSTQVRTPPLKSSSVYWFLESFPPSALVQDRSLFYVDGWMKPPKFSSHLCVIYIPITYIIISVGMDEITKLTTDYTCGVTHHMYIFFHWNGWNLKVDLTHVPYTHPHSFYNEMNETLKSWPHTYAIHHTNTTLNWMKPQKSLHTCVIH
jgi:hypothetical protein